MDGRLFCLDIVVFEGDGLRYPETNYSLSWCSENFECEPAKEQETANAFCQMKGFAYADDFPVFCESYHPWKEARPSVVFDGFNFTVQNCDFHRTINKIVCRERKGK